MSNSKAFIKDRKTENLSQQNIEAQKASNNLDDPERSYKGLHSPDFSENKKRGSVVLIGEADSALYLGQDARYGTTLKEEQSGGDFANKIVLAVGFLNEGKSDGDEIDLSDPNLRYGAGLTIYQKTDTGKENVFDSNNAKNKDRKATTRAPQNAVSVFEINADVVEVKARNGGVNIVAGYDPTLPNYGNKTMAERANTEYLGVNLIFGNPDSDKLNDTNSVFGLQPLVKGINLTKRLEDMNNQIKDISKTVFALQKSQAGLELVLGAHTHPTVGLGAGVALPSIELAVSTYAVKTPLNIFNILQTVTNAYNQVALDINMSGISEGGILSKFNFTN